MAKNYYLFHLSVSTTQLHPINLQLPESTPQRQNAVQGPPFTQKPEYVPFIFLTCYIHFCTLSTVLNLWWALKEF